MSGWRSLRGCKPRGMSTYLEEAIWAQFAALGNRLPKPWSYHHVVRVCYLQGGNVQRCEVEVRGVGCTIYILHDHDHGA